ncbi:MAG: protein kinase [Gemmatimonas sp.]
MAELTSPPPRFPNGEYEIEGIVGKGGMAIVYRARDMRHPREVAIKVLRPEVAQSIGTTRFLREIAVAAPFSHPHILPLIDSGELVDEKGQSTPYYVMPLVDGETLHQKLVREGRLPIAVVLRITREILEALQYAHAQGVIHRDIKPANILLSGGHAVVADFGVSRPLPPKIDGIAGDPGLTLTGDVIGTPSYMSPEQALGHRVIDARSDIFSVGCVMYEMLVGDRPFDTPIPQYTATKKRHGIYTSARDARKDVSEALDQVLAKALKAEPDDRYASASAFLVALAQLDEKDTGGWGMLQQPVSGWVRNVAIGALAVVGVVAATMKGGRTTNVSEAAAAPAAIASDKSRVAVLPIEQLTPDSLLNIIANGFQTDLIDELAQYPALTVISKNGVLQFRGNNASTDSIARALNVGSVVAGDIRHFGDSVRVSVRLIDGASGAILSTAQDSGTIRDLLAVRSSVINSVTAFLRKEIGKELHASERRQVSSSEAWELRIRVLNMTEAAWGFATSLTPRERQSRFNSADSLLSRAAKLDEHWPAPLITSSSLHLQRANIEDQVLQLRPDANADQGFPKRFRLLALERANEALMREPGNASAYYLRGKAEFDLWRTATPLAPESMRAAAEADLRRAVAGRRDMADAWSDLSTLLQFSGEYAQSRIAADSALRSDAFLGSAPIVYSKLFQMSLATGDSAQARRWCEEGRREYPNSPQFWSCSLSLLAWTGKTPADVGRGWDLLRAAEARDTLHQLASGATSRQLFVAAIAARAGLEDSATAIVKRARASMPDGASSPNADFAEAYVHTLLNRPDDALPLLDRFLHSAPAQLGYVRKHPWFIALRTNPKFIVLTEAR